MIDFYGQKSTFCPQYELKNIFDIDSAVRICDFVYHQKPILQSSSQKLKDICDKYGISASTKKCQTFQLFFHLEKILPEKNLFEELMDLHLKKSAKNVKNDFLTKCEEIPGKIIFEHEEKVDENWIKKQQKNYEQKLVESGVSDLIK